MNRYPKIDLTNATVVITGGARGIGAATARAFSKRGATVWIGDLDAALAQETATSIPRCHATELNVTSETSWTEFLSTVAISSGSIDVLVNNAGVMPLGGFLEQPSELSKLILDVNVHGPINGVKAALPGMLEQGRGHIVTVASMAGKLPIPGMVVYNASKFGAVGLSLALQHEYANSGVSFSCVMPSAVRTELSSGATLTGIPTVNPEDVADAIVNTVHTRAQQVSVPRFVNPAVALMDAVVPERLERLARQIFGDRRALDGINRNARRAYEDRVASQTVASQGGAE
ncbi:SDR family oxidoreductase [Hoyosella rhizosphaerae]|uniref:Short chain dehydrogenase/reductase n=1 Tax=Hoyosella rhizosphaerae TaxID=1755582 RepID=A0A916X9M2_9ACTN|nr:SDR family oxidoreductase [Hoyosella rhizosphaerae]MBN4926961.1 SDR family oxidoreductase [Hoyosella rhizosphaerae]GGC55134.1 putative short chain dehydrogenase/reductase [Hoyosella rhizosphaerae]